MASYQAEVFKLHPATVIVGPRIGLFWPEKAAAIGAKMQRVGQNDPIKVTHKEGQWELVTGYHRLQGAIGLALDAIDAIEVAGTADDLLDIEASENLDRRDFEPIERALFVRAAVDLAERRAEKQRGGASPHQLAIAARWNRVKNNVAVRLDEKAAAEAEYTECISCTAYGWSEEMADSLGMSRRSLFDSLKIHRQLIAPFERELWEELARVPLGRKKKSLVEIADIADEMTRRLVIDTIVGDEAGEIKSVDDAMIAAGARAAAAKVRLSGDTKHMNGAQSNLSRLSAAGWRSFAPTLVEMAKPAALRELRAAIDARLAELGDDLGEDAE